MKSLILTLLAWLSLQETQAFCGFFAGKADGTPKNKKSQVILARHGQKTRVTMYNEFKGQAKDFALVVPVPVLLRQADIKVVDAAIFDVLNSYSSPRLAEYFDENPCSRIVYEYKKESMIVMNDSEVAMAAPATQQKYGVRIEARYLVGEYDILILGARESSGLRRWLTDNGYAIPDATNEVLDPYIRSNMKFFVAKVRRDKLSELNNGFLKPIQITYSSPKFMLPIRLGMANADGDQDMIVYGLTRGGRMECTNYRNVLVPTNQAVPLFVKNEFDRFYGHVFTRQWEKEGGNISFLEYAWDVTPVNPMKCDPCTGNPPLAADLIQAGAWWLQPADPMDYSDPDQDWQDGNEQTFFTRMHIRYNRSLFPQDLVFQETPNRQSFQARYVITHPAAGSLNCLAGKKYLADVKVRRKKELNSLEMLTGLNYAQWTAELSHTLSDSMEGSLSYATLADDLQHEEKQSSQGMALMAMTSLLMIGSAGWLRWKGMI